VPTDAQREPEELASYAEQEASPQEDGSTSAAEQRREADHIEQHREGSGDPLSGTSQSVHPQSRRAGGGSGRPDRSVPSPDQIARP